MVCMWEYRMVLPFTLEEYKIAQLYMVAKYSASESNGNDGDGVELLVNEPFEEEDRKGQYTRKVYHLASKLPSWLVSLFPKKALTLEEEAWNAYPYCMTVLKCPFFSNFRLVLETKHIADRGTTENALDLEPKTLKKRIVDFIDIAMDPVDNYVEAEDPSKFSSLKTGRGPLLQGWQQKCQPVMCAYKLVTVDVPYWGFGSRLEKFIGKTAQRKIFLEGHRKCFCWLDEWFGLTMEDVRRMEHETAEAIRKARAMILGRPGEGGEEEVGFVDLPDQEAAAGTPRGEGAKDYSRCNSREISSPRPPPSLVGPSVAVGITTISASELETISFVSDGSQPAPSMRSPRGPRSARNSFAAEEKKIAPAATGNNTVFLQHAHSYEFYPSLDSSPPWNGAVSTEATETDVVAQCVDVLDRVIAWTKTRPPGAVPSLEKQLGSVSKKKQAGNDSDADKTSIKCSTPFSLDYYVSVIDKAVSLVIKRRQQ